MRIEDYPPQEPLPEIARDFHERMMAAGEGVEAVEYSFGENPSQSIAVHPSGVADAPVLLFLHGGGWTNGYKEQMAFLAPALNAEGITLVSASYRLAPAHVFPANFEDVVDAVAKTVAVAPAHGFDPRRLFIGGHSAGGHLAALAALDESWQGARGLSADIIKGCLPLSATYDFTPGNGGNVRPRFLGPEGTFSEVRASPLFRIGQRKPPFHISFGTADIAHLPDQARKFAMVYRAAGGEADMLELPDATHIDVMLQAPVLEKPWLPAAVGWMRRIASHLE